MTRTRIICSLVALALLAIVGNASTSSSQATATHRDIATLERAIKLEIVVDAPIAKVWNAWTTREGIKSFFARECDIELRVLGKYDILFAPNAPPGLRGAEGNLVLAIQEPEMLSFTWDAPAKFPNIRKQRTSVVLRFVELDKATTKVLFTQSGWGTGKEWDDVYAYFIPAWSEFVLPNLKYSLEVGPIDWSKPPKALERARVVH